MNSILSTKVRPTVLFNVQNPEHRRYAWQFLKTRTWSGCPVMFALPEGEPSVHTLVSREMAVFYADREFATVATTPQSRIRAVL